MESSPFELPVKALESNGTIVDSEGDIVLKVVFRPINYRHQLKQLFYAAKAINSHEKLVDTLRKLRDECDDNNHNKHHKEFHRMCKICVIDEALEEAGKQ